MKKILLSTLCLLFANIIISAQTAEASLINVNKIEDEQLKPIARKIAFMQNNNVKFLKLDAFINTVDFTRLKVPEIIQNDGWLLQPNLDVFKAIQLKKPQALSINIPNNKGENIKLLLYRVNIGTSDFKIEFSDGRLITEEPGAHYQGIIEGDNNSLVALSFFDDQVMGLICNKIGNYNLGLVRDDNEDKIHIMYNDMTIMKDNKFTCGTVNNDGVLMNTEPASGQRNSGDCITVHYEVDQDLFFWHGTPGTENWVSGLSNQVNAFNANEGINTYTKSIHVWTSNSPYTGSDKYQRLQSFKDVSGTFDSDVALLLDNHDTYGGLATVQGLCRPDWDNRLGYCGLEIIYYNIPTWSWSVCCTAHELGHLLGSEHTHACVWNGNNTAIDGCADVEGTCPKPGLPPLGQGTVMSYCNTQITGINLGLGYSTQPKNAILNNIATQTCLFQACTPCASCPLNGFSVNNFTPCNDNGTCIPNDDYKTVTLNVFHNACGAVNPEDQFIVTVEVTGQVFGPFSYTNGTQTTVNFTVPYYVPQTSIQVKDVYFDCISSGVIGFTGLQPCSNYTPPTITCPNDATVNCIDSAIPAVTGAALGYDCSNNAIAGTYTDTKIPFTPLCLSNQHITRTWKVTDSANGTNVCVQNIYSVDNISPVVSSCPANVTVSCDTEVPSTNYSEFIVADACSAVQKSILSEIKSNQTCVNSYILSRVYKATDNCGNTAVCTQVITVNDNTKPTITCPPDVQKTCASEVPPSDLTAVVASDNCVEAPVKTLESENIIAFICTNRYTKQRIYKATDACNNTQTCVQTITVNDIAPPTLTCPANLSISCSNLVPAPNIGLVSSSDNCSGPITIVHISDVISAQTCTNRYTITRTYRANDVCGNLTNCSQTIIVNDIIPPSITCPGTVTVSCVSQVPAVNTASVIASDNCTGTLTVTHVGDVITAQTCTNRYTITRTYRATDACGNSSTCSQLIIVNDQTPPTLTCPANITVSCATQVPVPNINNVIASDNCSGVVTVTFLSDIISNQTCTNRYTIIRTYKGTDVCGNSSTCSQIIIVNDVIPPSIGCPQDQYYSCASQVHSPNVSEISATDNCNQVPVITFVNDIISNQTCPNKYTITRTYRATDACGNSITCSQIINVNDKVAPVLSGVPGNINLECTDPIPQSPSVNATDNCSGVVNISYLEENNKSPWQQICESISYQVIRTWTATDVCGNSSSKSQTIQIKDTKAPLLTNLPPKYLNVQCNEDNDNNIDPIPVDACDPNPSMLLDIKYIPYLNGCVNSYTAIYTWTAGDKCGNTTQYTQYISVEDTEAPEIQCPSNIEINSVLPVVVNWKAPIADDYCDGSMSTFQIQGPNSGSVFIPGSKTLIVYSVTDECGNISTCSFTININTGNKPASEEIVLFQNEPNPFNAYSKIKFSLPSDMFIELSILDIQGKLIKIYKGEFKKGLNDIDIDASDLQSSGMYLYQLKANGTLITKKMVFVY